MRKGQLTIFIILGLILIITIGMVLYFVTTEAAKPWRTAPSVPSDVRPVFDMVNDCAKNALKQGLIIQGLQGGYIEIPAFVLSNPDSYINADSLGVVKVPFWYYETENRIPSYGLMQTQLARYIKQEIQTCVNFQALAPSQMVQILEEPDVLVTYAEEEVVAEIKWPLNINTQQRTVMHSEYFALQESRYREMYDTAVQILAEENKQKWLEKLTIDMMSGDDKIPLGGMEAGCTQKKWNLETVQERMKKILFYTIPMIRIKNTPQPAPLAAQRVYDELKSKGEDITEDLIKGKISSVEIEGDIPADVYEINKMTFDPKLSSTDLKVKFVYDPSQLLMSALPHDGKWLKSEVAKGSKNLIPFFCMNQWHFTYDIIYPLKVIVKDDKAFDNQGFVFQFGTPVIISDNAPERVNFGMRQFEPMYIGSGFCEEQGEREIKIKVLGFEPYSPVGIPLEEVNITLECMSIDCEMGETQVQSNGDIELRTNVPQGCGNPRVLATKKGYLDSAQWLTQDTLDIYLKKLQALKPEFVIHPYQSNMRQWQTDQNRFKLKDKERIMLSLKLKGTDYEQYKIFPEDETLDFVLDDARYELEMYLVAGDMIIGGYQKENYGVSYHDLLGKDKIQLNLVEYRPNPSREQDLQNLLAFLDKGYYDATTKYQTALLPIIK